MGAGRLKVLIHISFPLVEIYPRNKVAVACFERNPFLKTSGVGARHNRYIGLLRELEAKVLQDGKELLSGAQDEHVVLEGVSSAAGADCIDDVVEEVIEHRNQQGGEKQQAENGHDQAEPVVLALACEVASVKVQGNYVLPTEIPTPEQD